VKAGWRIRRLTDGSTLVARRVGRTFVPLDPDGEIRIIATLLRCGPAIAATPRLLDLAHQSPIWLAGGTGAWCVAAWRAKPDKAAAAPADEQEPEELAEDGGQADDGTEFLALLHHLMPEPSGRVHLAQIAEHLSGDPKLTGPVRELCGAAGIPITAVRVPGRGSSTGVYRRDLPPLPDPSRQPLPAVVGAGQSGQQQHQQHAGEGFEKGFVTVPDPDGEPNQTLVIWPDQAARHAS